MGGELETKSITDPYLTSFTADITLAEQYYRKSYQKTEQQKFLEELLLTDAVFKAANIVGDIACGGGTLSHHLARINMNAKFVLVDALDEGLHISKEFNSCYGERFQHYKNDMYSLDFYDDTFDVAFCWQTLFLLDDAEAALSELLRVTKPGGKVYVSSLFNLDHDLDIYSKFYDFTRNSGKNGMPTNYNTYCSLTVSNWLKSKVASFTLHKFTPNIDLNYDGRGIGTFTRRVDGGDRVQISGGMLMNWAILEIVK